MSPHGTKATAIVSGLLALLVAVSRAAIAGQERFPLPPKDWPEPTADHPIIPFLLIDRLEYQRNDQGADTRLWDAQGWIGGDWNRFWFKTEGENAVGGRTAEAEFQALYARLIAPFWYLQAGARYDAHPEPTRTFAVLGVQGLAPYWFEVEATASISNEGETSARLKVEYELLFTQRLILQPLLETNLAAQTVEEHGIGQGFNNLELGARLRYEIKREFAPYIGVSWTRKFGDTADLAEAVGEETQETGIVAGVRAWF